MRLRVTIFAFTLLGVIGLFSPFAHAAPIAATAVVVEGNVAAIGLKRERRPLHKGDSIAEGETLVTAAASAIEIEFDSGARIRVDANTRMTIKTLRRNRAGATRSIFSLFTGRVRSFVTHLVSRQSVFSYETKAAIAGVAGTDFIVTVPDENTLRLMVLPKEEVADMKRKGASDTSLCEQPHSWEQGRVYLIGTDPAKTRIVVDSCHMTSVVAGSPPRAPSLIPDAMIFDFLDRLPFALPPTASAPLEQEMMNTIANQISVPLVQSDPATTPIRGADRVFTQGQGLTSGASGGGTPVSDGLVRGSVTLDIGR